MRFKYLLMAAILTVFTGQLFVSSQAYAANPADFNPGRIIDDELFYNKDDMSVAEIQSFLNAHVPACDTWGTGPSGYGNLTRAQYAQQIMGWHGPPYTCLNNYHENPETGATSFENGGGAFAGGISTAQIIYNAAQQYGINPKVLLVTLRKEALNIYGDSWPLKSQYRYAMGYACPDSGPNYSAACVDSKAGFYKQMTLAAWQFRHYYNNMGSYNFAPGRWNTIQYNPQPSCGTKEVYIQNYATASLYIYTPYTPNDAALNAYPGTAHCGAYGNRNFWFMWQEWFGSTYAGAHITSPLRVTSQYGDFAFSDLLTTVSFDVTNDSSSPIDIGGMAVAVRDSSGGNHDFSLKQMIIPARSTVTYTDSRVFNKEDTYTFSLANYSGSQWRNDYPTMVNAVEPRSKTISLWKSPTLTEGITIQNGPLQAGKTHTITFKVRNNSLLTQTIGSLGLAVRGPNNVSLDPSPAAPVVLAAGESRLMSYSFKPTSEGAYTFGIASKLSSWVAGYPKPLNGTIENTLTVTAAPKVVLNSALTSLSNDPRTGQRIILEFKVKNNSEDIVDLGKLGLWGRDPQNRNIDPGVVPIVLSPGEERLISMSFKPSQAGIYNFGILGNQGDAWNEGPTSPASHIRKISVVVKEGVVVSDSVVLGNTQTLGYQGQSTSVSFKVKNFSEDIVDLGKLGLWGRDPQNRNIDPGVVPVTLNPGEERMLNFPVLLLVKGTHNFGILQTKNNGISWGDGPIAETAKKKQLTFQVMSGVTILQGVYSSADVQAIHNTQNTDIRFTVKNHTSNSINLGKLGLWGRDPQNRNIDPGVSAVTLGPNEERVISLPVRFNAGSGEYRFGILQTLDNGATWMSGPDVAPGQSSDIQVNVKPSVTLVGSLGSTPTAINVGQCATLYYTVKNFDTSSSVDLGKLGLWGRDPQNRNIDPGVSAVTLGPNEERVISTGTCVAIKGKYSFGILQTIDNGITWSDGPQKDSSNLSKTIQLTVN